MQKHSKLISVIISLVAALILWAYAVVYVSPKSSMDFNSIPVVLRGDDVLKARGLILISGRDQTVNITVGGNRSDLIKLSSDNIKLTADLSNITGAGTWDVTYTITYPDTVANGDLVVEGRSSSKVKVEVSLAATKPLRPTLNVVGEPRDGCLFDRPNLSCDVDTVTIYGPSAEVDPVKKVQIDVDIANMNASEVRSLSYRLLDADDNEVTLSDLCTVTLNRREGSEGIGDEVLVSIPVLPYKELYLQPNFINSPANLTVGPCFFTPEKITVTGDSQVLNQQSNDLLVDVDMSGTTFEKGSWTIPCVITLDSGLVAYTANNPDFDGINVKAVVQVRPLPAMPTATTSEPEDPEEPAE